MFPESTQTRAHPVPSTGTPQAPEWGYMLLPRSDSTWVPGLTMLWDSQAHKRMSSCWPLPGLSILHTPRKLPYLPLSGHPYLWAPPPPTLPTRCHLPSLNPQVQPSTVGALTSDPGPPLPTRECTFCLKPVFPSFAIGQPPPVNSGSSLSE